MGQIIFCEGNGGSQDIVHTTDDFCVIRVKQSAPEYTVGTFERSYEDEYVLVSYARKNGLDGKVSRIRVD